jgi:ketosteroid isomerase-like protein
MTHAEAEQFFARRQELWRARDIEGLAKTHTEDGTVSSPMLGPLKGRAEIALSYQNLFRAFSDFAFRGDALLIDGDRVAQPFTVTATHTGDFMGLHGTGRHAQFQGVMLYDMAGGLIANERRVYDFTGLLLQIGVLRGKPAK